MKPDIKCTVFEDNNGAMELAKAPKMQTRTKHIGLKYHFFRSMVSKKIINIEPIHTDEQTADIFTKPLVLVKFEKLRKKLNGW